MVLNKERINKSSYTLNLNCCKGMISVKAIINGYPEVRKYVINP